MSMENTVDNSLEVCNLLDIICTEYHCTLIVGTFTSQGTGSHRFGVESKSKHTLQPIDRQRIRRR